MDDWYMWQAFFTTGSVLDYLRYKGIQNAKDTVQTPLQGRIPMKFQTQGLIIKEQNIGEQDKLVFALTKSNGIIKAFVRGAKNLKNQKCASTSLLSYSRFTIYKGRDSYIIGDAQTIRIFSKLRSDMRKMCLAQYFCELALTICPREQKSDAFLSLILNSLYLLARKNEAQSLLSRALKCVLQVWRAICPTSECAEAAENTAQKKCIFFRGSACLNAEAVTQITLKFQLS